MPTPNELRAEALNKNGAAMDNARSLVEPAEFRAETIMWTDPNGGHSERIKLEGYASVTDKWYTMYDMFGEYKERISSGAFDVTLGKSPDVAFLVNHRGVTMARTTNGSLELSADKKGLKPTAYLNPKRGDVKDLVLAVEDKDVTEMSFAFMIDEGEWNEDYTEYSINQVDLNRGDVSAVNYGANPFTSVSARQVEIIRDFRELPAGAQRAAMLGLDVTSVEPHTELATPSYALIDLNSYIAERELKARGLAKD